MKNKELLIILLTEKNNGTNKLTFKEISTLTGYHPKSLIRLNKVLKEKGIGAVKIHGNIGKKHNNNLNDTEIIVEQKKNCPEMSFLKFCKYYNGIVSNPNSNFKPRSYNYIYNVLTKAGISSTLKHSIYENLPSQIEEAKSMLILKDVEIKLKNSNLYLTLFLALDAVSNQVIYAHISQKDKKAGYYSMLRNLIKEYGVPENIYAHGLPVFRAPKNSITQLQRIFTELGTNLFLNYDRKLLKTISTIQKEILNDLTGALNMRDFKSIREMNDFVKNKYMLAFNKHRIKNDGQSIFLACKNDVFDSILCEKYKRKIVWQGSYNNVQFRNMLYHIEGLEPKLESGTDVMVHLYFNGEVRVWYEGNLYGISVLRKMNSVKGMVRE